MYLKILEDLTLQPLTQEPSNEDLLEVDEGVAVIIKYDGVLVCWREAVVEIDEDETTGEVVACIKEWRRL